jgi:hypothetical protein
MSAYLVEVANKFAHKSFGNLGNVDVAVSVESATLNGVAIGERAVTYLIAYGVRQAFTDCYSQAKDAAKAIEMLTKKIEAVQSGKISIRERMDAFGKAMAELTLKAFEDSAKMTFAAFAKSIDDEEKANAVFDKFAESVRAELEPIARERLARESGLGEKAAVSVESILADINKPDEPKAEEKPKANGKK